MGKHRLQYCAAFNPLEYLEGEQRRNLQQLLMTQGVTTPLHLPFLRRKSDWAVALLPSVFNSDFRQFTDNTMNDLAARDAILAEIKDIYPFRSWQPGRRIIHRDGLFFYHHEYIRLLRQHAPQPAFFVALVSFLNTAKTQPSLIQGSKQRPQAKPPEERPLVNGRRGRGLGWLPEEDQVLRQWFGIRTVGDHAGHHASLTDAEWARLLELLGGMRTRRSVMQRIGVLNRALKREFSVDGYIPRDRVREYMGRVLGERPRFPWIAPTTRARSRRPG